MVQHIKTGKKGEELAAQHLMLLGFVILSQNWRYRHWEIDIIAVKNNVLHFVEVKTRKSSKNGYPDDEVGVKKIKNMISAAEIYLLRFPQWQRVQFDILAIILEPGIEFFFIEDVYL
ncbi:MAG: YraN family protein [Ferruginibacter sp.]|nr:YraN family protein [Ferruginibacter sp.]